MENNYLAEVRRRCIAYGMQPTDVPSPVTTVSEEHLQRQKRVYADILEVTKGFGENTIQLLNGQMVSFLVTDDKGLVIDSFGDRIIREHLSQLNIKEGSLLIEREVGICATLITLENKIPFQTVGTDHYHLVLHESACHSVPFSVPGNHGVREGTISLMTSIVDFSNYQLAMLVNMVESMGRELKLRKTNQRQLDLHHLMVDNLDTGILLADRSGTVVDFNHVALNIIPDYISVGQSSYQITELGPHFLQTIANGQRQRGIEVHFHAGGTHTVCLADIIPIFENGIIQGAYAQLRDITERYLLEQQIIVSEKLSAIGKLAAGLAHEIRNPLTSIMGFVQIIRERPLDPDTARYLGFVHEELVRVKNLVSDFVTMSKPSFPIVKPIEINLFLDSVLDFMEGQAALHDIRFIRDYHTGDQDILYADASQIKQVLINILQNAVEASQPKEAVTLKSTIQNKHLTITISDNGSGISPENLTKIQNPFFTTKENGTGLGLSVSYRIINNHNGEITVDSRLGAGTEFNIRLPLSGILKECPV
ncbi:nitrogen regulation protein NR(II) [Paenibacillus sp. Y412MC10]|uniref:two-component system sensor histidine kinase NtrB n=1 Tax=Geobacillus sp. (strain Y412MC10) TaxID=481743 RepID=UPI0011A6C131|nr:ATP-binding protein [Paenibacillus sp. Y412MC10]